MPEMAASEPLVDSYIQHRLEPCPADVHVPIVEEIPGQDQPHGTRGRVTVSEGGAPLLLGKLSLCDAGGSDFHVHGLFSGSSLQTSLPVVGTLDPSPPLTRVFLLEQMFL